LKEKSFWR